MKVEVEDIVGKESEKIIAMLTIKGLKIKMIWYRDFSEEWNEEWMRAEVDEVVWHKTPYSRTRFIYSKAKGDITRGGKKLILARIRRKYNITREEWQRIMGIIGSFLSNPLRFLLKYGIEPRHVRLIDLARAGLI